MRIETILALILMSFWISIIVGWATSYLYKLYKS